MVFFSWAISSSFFSSSNFNCSVLASCMGGDHSTEKCIITNINDFSECSAWRLIHRFINTLTVKSILLTNCTVKKSALCRSSAIKQHHYPPGSSPPLRLCHASPARILRRCWPPDPRCWRTAPSSCLSVRFCTPPSPTCQRTCRRVQVGLQLWTPRKQSIQLPEEQTHYGNQRTCCSEGSL